ncbi:MAG: hypothetical protein QXH95_00085 [Thermoplasmata archaeon]
MNWDKLFKNIGNEQKNILIKVRVKSGPIKIEKEIRDVLKSKDFNYLMHHWSPYSSTGLMEIGIGKSKVFLEWYSGNQEGIILSQEIEKYDVFQFDEYISSGIIESSVLRLMRDQY